MGSQSENDS